MTKSLSPSIGVRRRHRSDPKAAQSSSPIASPAKRQRLLHHLPITPASTKYSRSYRATTSADNNNRTDIRLPIDAVSASFLYLDVGDVPSASTICKDWYAAMEKVEEELWLGLIRKHCPSVEEVTKMLKLSSPESRNSTSCSSCSCSTTTTIPAPSLSWRGQFQRHILLNKSDDDGAAAQTMAAEKPPPKPLSSYLFQVDLVLYQERKGQTGKGEQVGVVTRVFSDCTFSGNGRIPLKMDRLGEEMAQCDEFTTFDFLITIYDKATGRQAMIHNHGMEDWWDSNLWFFGFGRIADAYKLDGFGTSDTISTMLSVEKIGCVANGGDEDDSWEFFSPPTRKDCCKCSTAWFCFWNMMLELWIVADFEWDIVDMDKDQQLRVLEEIVEFK